MNHSPWLHRYALLVAVSTLFLIVAGASVTSNNAGLSVPDWPLSYGQVMPEMKGGVFFEHGHRMVASAVGFLTIILAIWLWRADSRRWLRWLGVGALAAVVFQGILGGLTVLYLLPKPVSMSHAALAQLFFTTTVLIAMFTSPGWREPVRPVEDSGWPSLRTIAAAAPFIVLVQLLLGAGFRHKAFGIMPHIAGALVVTLVLLVYAMFILTKADAPRGLKLSAQLLLWITMAQVVLGIAAYLARLSNTGIDPAPSLVWFTVGHVATGALTMAATAALSVQVLRAVRPQAHAAPEHGRRAAVLR
jgi:heme a synthase